MTDTAARYTGRGEIEGERVDQEAGNGFSEEVSVAEIGQRESAGIEQGFRGRMVREDDVKEQR